MSDLLRWFSERSETVQLGILTLFGGISAGFWAAVAAWRKPAIQAAASTPSTTSTAPRSSDDPALLILAELSAVNVALSQILAALKAQELSEAALIETIDKLTAEMYLLRNVLGNRGVGM